MAAAELLDALKDQLAFFESGGYGFPYRGFWRPTLALRDLPTLSECCHGHAAPLRGSVLVFLQMGLWKRGWICKISNWTHVASSIGERKNPFPEEATKKEWLLR